MCFLTASLRADAPRGPLKPAVFEPEPAGDAFRSVGSAAMLRLNSGGIQFGAPDKPAIRLALAGSRSTRPAGDELLPSNSNYFLGNDPSSWRTNVPNYRKIRYQGVYPGIDLVFREAEGRFEYDFLLAAHADPGRIRLRFDGARELALNAAGDLVADGWLVERRPRVYQETPHGRREVSGRFRLHSGPTVSFARISTWWPRPPMAHIFFRWALFPE
jgi:hypothetical protein